MRRAARTGEGIQDDVVAGGDRLEQTTQHPLVLRILELRAFREDAHQRLVGGAAILIEDAGENLRVGFVQVALQVRDTGLVFAEMDSAFRNRSQHCLLLGKSPAAQGSLDRLAGLRMNHLVVRPAAAWPRHVAGEVHALGVDPAVVAVRPRLVLLVQRPEPILEVVGGRGEVPVPPRDELGCLALHVVRAFLEGPPAVVVGAHRLHAPRIAEHVVVPDGDEAGVVLAGAFPHERTDEVVLAEHLVHQQAQPVDFVVVDGNEDRAVVAQEFAQQLQPRQHHAQPLVVAGEVFGVHHLAQPLAHHRRVHVVVVHPALAADVVGRVDVHALHAPVVGGQQRLQRQQVVAVDDEVVVEARLPAHAIAPHRRQRVVGHGQVEVLHQRLALEVQ